MAASEYVDLICHLPEESATMRALSPDWRWNLEALLLAALIDETRAGWWLYERVTTKSKRKLPKPIPRPGVEPVEDADSTTYGKGSAMPLDEMAEWLGWN